MFEAEDLIWAIAPVNRGADDGSMAEKVITAVQ